MCVQLTKTKTTMNKQKKESRLYVRVDENLKNEIETISKELETDVSKLIRVIMTNFVEEYYERKDNAEQ